MPLPPIPSQQSCTDPRIGEWLIPYGLATLDPGEMELFENHLMQCPACCARLGTYASVLDELHQLRPDIVEALQASGNGFEDQLIGIKSTCRRHPTRMGWWADFLHRLLNPRIVIPACVVVALILVIPLAKSPDLQPVIPSPIAQENRELLLRGSSPTRPRSQRPDQTGERKYTAPIVVPDTPFVGSGIRAYGDCNFAEAARVLNDSVRRNPADTSAWQYLGMALLGHRDSVQAVRTLSEADRLAGGRNPLFRRLIGLASAPRGDTVFNTIRKPFKIK
jgi:hypothetical protein